MIISQIILNKIIKDLQNKANNKDREVYLDLHRYDVKINRETTEYILEYLKIEKVIEKGIIDGKGLIRCTVCKI